MGYLKYVGVDFMSILETVKGLFATFKTVCTLCFRCLVCISIHILFL